MSAANNPRLADVGSQANRRRASDAGRANVSLARQSVAALRAQGPSDHRERWIEALQRRLENPDATLGELARAMSSPMTKSAYASLLRRALSAAKAGETAR